MSAKIKLRAREVMTIRRQDGGLRVKMGGPGLRGLPGVPGIGTGGLGLPSPGAANQIAYYTGPNVLALTGLHPFAHGVIDKGNGGLWLGQLGMRVFSGSIANNAAISINLTQDYGANQANLIFVMGNQPPGGIGIAWVNNAGAAAVRVLSDASPAQILQGIDGSGTLTGTTGQATKLTLRGESQGILWVENRTGAARPYTIYCFR